MTKKILALAGAGALLLSVAVPVFGCYPRKDIAIIKGNEVVAVANTGGNSQSSFASADNYSAASVSGGSGARSMTGGTGNAYAKAKGVIVANTHVSCDGCGCREPRHKDVAVVKNNLVGAEANTGDNVQDDMALADHHSNASVSGGSGARSMTGGTGNAYAKAKGFVVVNTHLSCGDGSCF